MTSGLTDRSPIVTGAGNGSDARMRWGWRAAARVVVNDFGGARDGSGGLLRRRKPWSRKSGGRGEAMADGATCRTTSSQGDGREACEKWRQRRHALRQAGISRQILCQMEVADSPRCWTCI